MKATNTCFLALSVLLLAAGCQDPKQAPAPDSHAGTPPTNRIKVTADIQANLGMTWASARRGRLEHRIAVPGELVAPPDRQWSVRAPLSGTVAKIAAIWTPVKRGEVVAELVSAQLGDIQGKIYSALESAEEARMALRKARAEVKPEQAYAEALTQAAKQATEAETRAAAVLENARAVAQAAQDRVRELAALQGSEAVSRATLLSAQRDALDLDRGAVEAERALRSARVESRELDLKAVGARARASESARRLELITTRVAAAEAAHGQVLRSLAAASGWPIEELSEVENGAPRWATMRGVPLRAPAGGVVVGVHVSTGTWVDSNAPLVAIEDPSTLLFRAFVPEADAATVPPNASLEITVPGVDGAIPAGVAALRPLADAKTRSLLVEARVQNPDGKLRAGASATGRLLLSTSKSEEVLIPLDCVVRDGLESIVFRRDPAKPNEVIRVPVFLGARSAGWVEVVAGVGPQDELVKNGIHQLKQTGMGKADAGGHFHADGTFHKGH
ncbi:MAG: efflux RND transporter periplasmic adaptor subunit [Planctomycetota bacterium]|nr:efflux RND transporter periplasmic adaptor subunit [Planctomycetota bacterium]